MLVAVPVPMAVAVVRKGGGRYQQGRGGEGDLLEHGCLLSG
jgi:hypothetical protein